MIKMLRQSEVYQLERRVHARLLEEKVLHFEVSVCYALLVQIAHSGEHVAHELSGVPLGVEEAVWRDLEL